MLEHFGSEDDFGPKIFDNLEDGFYLVQVTGLNETSDNLEVDFEAKLGTKPGQAGKTHREFISLNAKTGNRKRRANLCLACGLITIQELLDSAKNGHGVMLRFEECPGRYLVIEIENQPEREQVANPQTGALEWRDKPGGKSRAKVPYANFWHPLHEDVNKVGIKVPEDLAKRLKADLEKVEAEYKSRLESPEEQKKQQESFF